MQAHGRDPQGEFEAQYHYDALGRRSRKAVRYKGKTEQTTRFLWQGYRLLQEQRDDGSRRSWSYDPASPWSPLAALEQAGDSRSADIYWYHTDLNSAPLEVTDAAGNLCWPGQYDTFGKLQGQTVAGAAKRQGAHTSSRCATPGNIRTTKAACTTTCSATTNPRWGVSPRRIR